ncbi:MAG: hypothetical protein AMXMBFR7_17210 [Planctomycetota bacterium]
MPRQIVVTISPEGEIEVRVEGQSGPSCQDLTRKLEDALGTAVADRRTPEFHQPDRQDHRQQTGR